MKILVRSCLAVLVLLAGCSSETTGQQSSGASSATATAVFGGGCFWCVEEAFDKVPGVVSTISGYTGGDVANPTYQQVSSGRTGHVEVVQVVYDPRQVSYGDLLDTFWRNVDPFVDDAQFCDHGDQYRSVIYYGDEQERALAERSRAAVMDRFSETVHTDIEPVSEFYPAEEYHQDYYEKNPVRYRFYKYTCGRAQRLDEIWG